MAKAREKAMMTDSGATNPRSMSTAQHNHFKTLVSSTLDNAVAVGHGHAVGSQGPKGHTMVPSDAHMQGGQYIPQGSFDGTGENGSDEPGSDDYGKVDKKG
jgi:hypothetical protein